MCVDVNPKQTINDKVVDKKVNAIKKKRLLFVSDLIMSRLEITASRRSSLICAAYGLLV